MVQGSQELEIGVGEDPNVASCPSQCLGLTGMFKTSIPHPLSLQITIEPPSHPPQVSKRTCLKVVLNLTNQRWYQVPVELWISMNSSICLGVLILETCEAKMG